MRNKNTALFQDFIPPYREEFLEKVNQKLDGKFCVILNSATPTEYKFRAVDSYNLQIRHQRKFNLWFPFLHSKLTLQFGVLRVMLGGEFSTIILPLQLSRIEVWISLLLNILIKKRVLLWGHAIRTGEPIISRTLRLFFMRMATGVIFYTKTRRQLSILHGFPPNKAFLAQNTVPTDEIFSIKNSIPESDYARFSHESGLEGKNVILYIGRLLPNKHPELLLQALPEILKSFPNAYILFIGAGAAYTDLTRMTEELGLHNYVRFTGQLFDNHTLSLYLNSSKIAVLPARAGLTIQHVFSYGIPMITNDDKRHMAPEIELIHDDTGCFFKTGDSKDLARVIVDLFNDPERLKKMSVACTRLMLEEYTSDKMAQGFVDAIQNTHPDKD